MGGELRGGQFKDKKMERENDRSSVESAFDGSIEVEKTKDKKQKTKVNGNGRPETIWIKTLKHITSKLGVSIGGINQNWNNSVNFVDEDFDDFEYGNTMPLLLIDDPPEQNRRFSLYADRRRSAKGSGSCSSCSFSCCCKCIIVGFAMIFFGCIGGLVGYIIACVLGHQGTLTSEPFYIALGQLNHTSRI